MRSMQIGLNRLQPWLSIPRRSLSINTICTDSGICFRHTHSLKASTIKCSTISQLIYGLCLHLKSSRYYYSSYIIFCMFPGKFFWSYPNVPRDMQVSFSITYLSLMGNRISNQSLPPNRKTPETLRFRGILRYSTIHTKCIQKYIIMICQSVIIR